MLCVPSCCFHSEAGPAGLPGADPAAQAQSGHPERRHGGSAPAQALRRHILWRQWGRQVYQLSQGEFNHLNSVCNESLMEFMVTFRIQKESVNNLPLMSGHREMIFLEF